MVDLYVGQGGYDGLGVDMIEWAIVVQTEYCKWLNGVLCTNGI